jgi:SAM-dependent methyltransferase
VSSEVSNEPRSSYRIGRGADEAAVERERLLTLARFRDPQTRKILGALGVGPGWACCDIGTGAGTVATWLAEQVGPNGRVVALDVDTRFADCPATVDLQTRDVTTEPIGDAEFDLVHGRAVLQHLHQREAVLDAMIAATRPGGWVVVTDSDWIQFHAQPVPEPFATLSRLTLEGSAQAYGHEPNWGRRMLPAFQARGLVDLEVEGIVDTMHGGTDSAEWYVGALARIGEFQRESMPLPDDFPFDAAIAQARDPDFAILSPVSLTIRGRRP